MSITIAAKYAPFSHCFGTSVPILQTSWVAKVYPTKIFLTNGEKSAQISFSMHGPFTQFVCILHAEKNYIEISGKASQGFFRFYLMVERCLVFVVKKKPSSCTVQFSGVPLEDIVVDKKVSSAEKLSLGVHKKQDIEAIRKRADLQEILPIWHKIAGFYPCVKEAIVEDVDLLYRTFWSEFSGIFCPEKDPFLLNIPNVIANPFLHGQKLISSCFFHYENNKLIFPSQSRFAFGKMINIECPIGRLDFTWSKKKMRKLILHVKKSATIYLLVPSVKYCRLTRNKKILDKQAFLDKPLVVKKNAQYILDRFGR